MRGLRWRRVPWAFLSCLCSCLLLPVLNTASPGGMSPEKTTTSFLSSDSNNVIAISKDLSTTTSADSTIGITGDTSPTVNGSLSPVTSGVSMTTKPGQSTLSFASTSIQESPAFSQTQQTQSMKTTSQSPSNSFTEVTMSTISSSPSGNALTDTASLGMSSPGETTTSYLPIISNTPLSTSKVLTRTTTTDSTTGNIGSTSLLVTKSPSPDTSAVSMTMGSGQSTLSFVSISTQETPAFSQTQPTQSIDTTSESQSSSLTEVSAAIPLSSTSGHTLTETSSLGTSLSSETTTPFPASVSSTRSATSEVLSMATSIDSSTGTMGGTSPPVTGSLSPLTSGVSMTTKPGQSALSFGSTSPQESLAFSQTRQTQWMETTSEFKSSSLTEVTMSTVSSSPKGNTLTETASLQTSLSGETASSFPTSVSSTSSATSEVSTSIDSTTLTETSMGISSPGETTTSYLPSISNIPLSTSEVPITAISTDSTTGNIGNTSPPVTVSLSPVTSGVSMTTKPGQSTLSFASTSLHRSPAFSQTQATQSVDTTRESQSSSPTEMTTAILLSSTSRHALTETASLQTSLSDGTTTPFPASVSSTPSTTPEVLSTATSIDSTVGTKGDTSPAATRSLYPVTLGVSMITKSGQSTLSVASTSTQESPAFSQTQATQSMDTTSEPQSSSPTEMTTAILLSSTSRRAWTETASLRTKLSGGTTTPFPASVSNTSSATSELLTIATSVDSTTGTKGDTSPATTGSLSPVTSGVSMTTKPGQPTLSVASTFPQESPAFSQTQQTQSIETISQSLSSTLTELTLSTVSSSPSGHTLTETASLQTSLSGGTTTPFPASVSSTSSSTSELLIMATSIESTIGTKGDTLPAATRSLSLVTSGVSMTTKPGQSTLSFASTSTQESPALSQTQLTQSMDTTSESQSSSLTEVSVAILLSSTSRRARTETASLWTTLSGGTTTPFPASVSSTPSTTPDVLSIATSRDSPIGTMGDTSPTVPGNLSPVTSGVSMTTKPGQPTLSFGSTSPQKSPAFSRTQQTQSIETISQSLSNTLTEVTLSTVSSSPSGHTLTETASLQTSLSGGTTTPFPVSVSNTSSSTSELLTIATSIDSTTGTKGDTSPATTGSLSPVTSGVSMTTKPGQSTLSFASTPTQESPALSQTQPTQSMDTTSESQSSSLTEVTTAIFLSSTSRRARTETASLWTSLSGGTTTSFPTSVSTTPSPTPEVLSMATSIDSTTGTIRDTSPPVTGNLFPLSSGVSMTTKPGQSTLSIANTSTQESPTFTQTELNQNMDTTSKSQSSSLAEVNVSTVSSSPGGHTLTDNASLQTSLSGDTTTSFPASFSSTSLATSEVLTMVTSMDPSTGTIRDTSPPVPGSLSPVTSGVSMTTKPGQSTLPFGSTSPQESPAFSQTQQTQNRETTSQSQSSSLIEVTLLTVSSSPSGHTLTETASLETSSAGETTISALSNISSIPPGSFEILTMAIATNSTPENMGETSPTFIGSPPPVTSGVSMTTKPEQTTQSFASTSTQESPPFSQTQHSQSMETPKEYQSSSLTRVTMSTVSSSPSGHTLIETFSPGTSSPGETATPSPADIINTPLSTPLVPTSATSTHSTIGNPGNISLAITGSLSPGVSMPAGLGQSTMSFVSTSTEESSAFSHTQQTQSMETTNKSQSNSLTKGTVSTLSIFPSGHTLTEAFSHDPSSAGMITTSLETGTWRSTMTSPPSTSSQTLTTPIPSTSPGSSSTAPPYPVNPEQGIPLFPYGLAAGDMKLFSMKVDFTSKLFKIKIGFPFGSSLRDSLYFTDNGQIIFPESDYHIFSYPYPPQRGFTGWEPMAMVAPFWDDADFSSNRGAIFYQEYETPYNENNLLVQKVETWIRKFTNTRIYKAKWTLKVTWDNVPAYPAQWALGTNTYQAVLTTDGSRSYALFLYQSGGMWWDVTQRPYSSVLMGFSSADGYFENSPLTFRPVWEKYRPDVFLNSKLGIRGLQVYKLHREERPNYRLKCLLWLKSRPQWPTWGWSQISCPCTWQQGQWDLRFQPISLGWWDRGSRQLCSFSFWRGGVCCSYGAWGEFREGWRVRSPWQFDQELEGQNLCCRWNDRPFFCALYQQRRPRVSCAGYRPPWPGLLFGDPHIVTLDDANFTFNGLGDFLLIRAWGGNSSFLLEGRTARTGSANATNFIAFAAQYSFSHQAPITVQWFLESKDTIRVLHDNQTLTFETSHTDAEGPKIFNTTGVLVTQNGSQVSASFDGTVTISVTALSNMLHASVSLPEEYRSHTEGLLGVWNNNPEDDFRMPNGSTFPRNSSEETLFHYGMTWKINGTGLLGKRSDHLPSNFTPVFLSQLWKNKPSDDKVFSECNGDTQCIYDALASGNTSTGLHTRMIHRTYLLMNATLNQYPPAINGHSEIFAYKGQTQRIQFTSNSENVTFALGNNCTDFQLFKNGSLLWTPRLLEPCTLEIVATNTEVRLSSVLQPRTVVCFCSAHSQCLYNQTSWVGDSSLEVASCKCDGDSFGLNCERSKDLCDEPCFQNVSCIPGKGCEACPLEMTGDGRHCTGLSALQDPFFCQNPSCPVNYCYNQGHCYISQTLGCQPTCTCPPAFTDTRCLVAGNSFTPITRRELPLRTIRLSLREGENASVADVNASVAHRLGTLEVRAFLQNSLVIKTSPPALLSGRLIQQWAVISQFQYRPGGPVIHFLNNLLLDAVVEAFLLQAPRGRRERSAGPRNDVTFYPISRGDVRDEAALNMSMLETYFECDGYKGYYIVYSPQSGVTCVSPCSEDYCYHGGQCQHLPDGPRCSCKSFSIYTAWGDRCQHLSLKLGAFFGILFGSLGALLLLGIVAFVILRFCGFSRPKVSYPLDSD